MDDKDKKKRDEEKKKNKNKDKDIYILGAETSCDETSAVAKKMEAETFFWE